MVMVHVVTCELMCKCGFHGLREVRGLVTGPILTGAMEDAFAELGEEHLNEYQGCEHTPEQSYTDVEVEGDGFTYLCVRTQCKCGYYGIRSEAVLGEIDVRTAEFQMELGADHRVYEPTCTRTLDFEVSCLPPSRTAI